MKRRTSDGRRPTRQLSFSTRAAFRATRTTSHATSPSGRTTMTLPRLLCSVPTTRTCARTARSFRRPLKTMTKPTHSPSQFCTIETTSPRTRTSSNASRFNMRGRLFRRISLLMFTRRTPTKALLSWPKDKDSNTRAGPSNQGQPYSRS